MGRTNRGLTGVVMRVHPMFKNILDKKIKNGEGFSYSEITKKLIDRGIVKETSPLEIMRENTFIFAKIKK